MRTVVVLACAALLLSACDSGAPAPSASSPVQTTVSVSPAPSSSLAPARRVFDPAHVQHGVRRVLTESYLMGSP